MATIIKQTAVDGTIDLQVGSVAATSGTPILVSGVVADLLCIPKADAAAAGQVAAYVGGVVFRHAKAAVAIESGEIAYWDNDNSVVTNANTSDTQIGYFVAAQLEGDANADVYLSQ